jgi:hypothetical protein
VLLTVITLPTINRHTKGMANLKIAQELFTSREWLCFTQLIQHRRTNTWTKPQLSDLGYDWLSVNHWSWWLRVQFYPSYWRSVYAVTPSGSTLEDDSTATCCRLLYRGIVYRVFNKLISKLQTQVRLDASHNNVPGCHTEHRRLRCRSYKSLNVIRSWSMMIRTEESRKDRKHCTPE